MSKLTRDQRRKFAATYEEDGRDCRIIATVRYDDECGNGHNTFAITADVHEGRRLDRCGCCHEDVAKHFPELAPLIKWHLCSSDGPLHYVANTTYHAKAIPEKQDKWWFSLEGKLIKIVDLKERAAMVSKYGQHAVFKDYPNSMAKDADLDAARSSAIWPDATAEQLTSEKALQERLPSLLTEFQRAVESLGFTY